MKLWAKAQLALLNLLALGKKGQGTLDTVMAVVVGAISLIIGILIVAEIFEGYDWESTWDTSTVAHNATRDAFDTTEEMTFTALGILPIVLLVSAAVAVIGAVLVLRGRR